ncbi:AP-1 complex subunit mu [Acrasis kona]|uniref:AP-1 complex subunit mu n=1 Tax=Acrasis kona TaxID=1008807 RepID=A0AAW2YLE4_9EUKA
MSGSASVLYILDLKGKPLISRNYRGDIPNNIIEKFRKRVVKEENESNIRPVFEDSGYSFFHVKHRNLFFVMVSKQNANAMMVLSFLLNVINVFKHYFREVEEESIKDNFVVVYELLDEMMDFGYPQSTEPKILQEFIKVESHKLQIDKKISEALGVGLGGNQFNISTLANSFSQLVVQLAEGAVQQVTNAEPSDNLSKVTVPKEFTANISWRPANIVHKKNECFLDVVESVNVLLSPSGSTLRSEILGVLKMRTFLTGMPELKLGLNDKVLFENLGRTTKGRAVELEDVKFHQCVRLNRFEQERTISFVPPDGEFDLMSYRLNTKVKALVMVDMESELHSESRIAYKVTAKSQFKRRSTANNVDIFIPVPRDSDTPTFTTSMGSAEYAPEHDAIKWTIKQFQGGKEYTMKCQVNLPSTTNGSTQYAEVKKRPVKVQFEIPYFTVSGLQVRYLKIMDKSGYQGLPWVRYITQSGEYSVRHN